MNGNFKSDPDASNGTAFLPKLKDAFVAEALKAKMNPAMEGLYLVSGRISLSGAAKADLNREVYFNRVRVLLIEVKHKYDTTKGADPWHQNNA